MSTVLASSARAQQHATRAAFFIPGFAIAVWAVLVPFAKARTGVDDGVLGLIRCAWAPARSSPCPSPALWPRAWAVAAS